MKPLTYYASGHPAIDALATSYGSSLQDLPLDDKLLAVIAIAKAMRNGVLNHDEASIADGIREEMEATSCTEVDDDVYDSIVALDDLDERQCYDLLVGLSNLAASEFRQFGS